MLVELAEMALNIILVGVFIVATILSLLAFPRALKETIYEPLDFDTVCVLVICVVVFIGWIQIIGLITGW